MNDTCMRALLLSSLLLLAQHAYAETEMEASNRILKQVSGQFAVQNRPAAPQLGNMPQPVARENPAELAQQFRQPPVVPLNPSTGYELLEFVSFSMPRESLLRIVEQSEKTGARIVFRGFKGDKFTVMTKEVAALIGTHHVTVATNPPQFTQFKIDIVPALVIAQSNAGEQMDSGCAQAARFVKVTGDVSQDYALDYIERNASQWAEAAQHFNSKLGGGLQ